MLRRSFRLSGTRAVAAVYRRGRTTRLDSLSMKHAPNGLSTSRLSVVVSKKVAPSAPLRNRIRRRVYAHFAQHWQQLEAGYDIILSVFSAEVAQLPPKDLHDQLEEVCRRAGLITSAQRAKGLL